MEAGKTPLLPGSGQGAIEAGVCSPGIGGQAAGAEDYIEGL